MGLIERVGDSSTRESDLGFRVQGFRSLGFRVLGFGLSDFAKSPPSSLNPVYNPSETPNQISFIKL